MSDANRHRFDGSKGGFRAWVSEMGEGSWCCEVKDAACKTQVVWFGSSELECRSRLATVGAALGCEFREIAGWA